MGAAGWIDWLKLKEESMSRDLNEWDFTTNDVLPQRKKRSYMISVSQNGRMYVGQVPNGIHNKRYFHSNNETYRLHELIDDMQDYMKLTEEMESEYGYIIN